jgi:hypothetical protein
VINHGKTNL